MVVREGGREGRREGGGRKGGREGEREIEVIGLIHTCTCTVHVPTHVAWLSAIAPAQVPVYLTRGGG